MTTSISIVTAHLGDVGVAVAADAVVRLGDDHSDLEHLGDLLWPEREAGMLPRVRRALTLAAGDGRIVVVAVDEPVEFTEVDANDLLAVPAILPPASVGFAIGFVRLAGGLVVVLHGPRIAAALAARTSAAAAAEESP